MNRINVFTSDKQFLISETDSSKISTFLNTYEGELDDIEIQVCYPNRLIRSIDYQTFKNIENIILGYFETSYYSGQDDGSFTVYDEKLLEDEFPDIWSYKNYDSDRLVSLVSYYVGESMGVRLVSANFITAWSLYEVVDALFFMMERPSYINTNCPQRDSLEFMESHFLTVDKRTRIPTRYSSREELFSRLFSSDILMEFNKSEYEDGGYSEY